MDMLTITDYLATSEYGWMPDEEGAEHADLVAPGHGTVRADWDWRKGGMSVTRYDGFAVVARAATGTMPEATIIWRTEFDGAGAPDAAVLAVIRAAESELGAEAGWRAAAPEPAITMLAREATELAAQWMAAANGADGDDAERDAAEAMAAAMIAALESAGHPSEAIGEMAEETMLRRAESDAYVARHAADILAWDAEERAERDQAEAWEAERAIGGPRYAGHAR